MMLYRWTCEVCSSARTTESALSEGPRAPDCCDESMQRVWRAPQIITRGDPSEVPLSARVTENTAYGDTPSAGRRKERRYQKRIEKRRKVLREAGNRGSIRHSHSVPTELYWGKIKQTGDQHYWKDPANLNRHKDCEVG